MFWLSVLIGWLIVNGYGMVPTYLYWMAFIIAPVAVIILFVMLLFVGSAADMSIVLLRKLRIVASLRLPGASNFSDGKLKIITVKKSNSLWPLAVCYLPVSQPTSRTFARNWLQNIVDRLFDAILLF